MDPERVKLILQGYTHRIIQYWIENKSLPNIEQFQKMQQEAIDDPALDDPLGSLRANKRRES